MKQFLLSKFFYAVLVVLLAWFWYANREIPVYVQDLTHEEQAVLEAYEIEPKAPWAKPGMTKEEMAKAFEESFSTPPKVDGTVWQVFEGDGYSMQVPLGYSSFRHDSIKGGKDASGTLIDAHSVSIWDYDENSVLGNSAVNLSVYPDMSQSPQEMSKEDHAIFGIPETSHKEMNIAGKDILWNRTENYAEAWVQGVGNKWFHMGFSFGYYDESELWREKRPLQQAVFKYIVYSFSTF